MTASSTATVAARGAKWVTLGALLQRGVQLAAVLILARLLSPGDFGLVAIASIVLAMVQRFKTFGLHTALIQRPTETQQAADAVFILHIAITGVAMLAIVGISTPLSRFFADPQAGAVVSWMALRLLPDALAAVPTAMALKALNYRIQALILLAEAIASAVTSVALAVAGWGVWSLVAGTLAGSVTAAGLWWIVTPWRPQFSFDRKIAREVFGFGVRFWSAGYLSFLVDAVIRTIIGKVLGIDTLGYYEITTRVVHTPLHQLISLGDRVAIPAFCKEQDNNATMRRWYLLLTTYLLLGTAAAAATLVVFADSLIPILFGAGWLPAVGAARALAPFALVAPLLHGWSVYISQGRARTILRFTATRVVATVALLVLAARLGLVAICLAESVAACLFAPVNVWLIAKVVRIRWREIRTTISPPALGFAAFVAVGFGARALFSGRSGEPTIWRLALQMVPAAVAFVAAAVAMRPGLPGEFAMILSRSLGRIQSDDTRPE